MTQSTIKRAQKCQFYRAALRELAAHLPAGDDELDRLLAQTVEARDDIAFANILFSSLDSGRQVDARHLAEGAIMLPNSTLVASAAMHCTGEVAEALVAAVESGSMKYDQKTTLLITAGIWCRERRNGVAPKSLLRSARTVARIYHDDIMIQTELLILAGILEDDDLASRLELIDLPDTHDIQRSITDRLIAECNQPVFTQVPDEPQHITPSGYTVRRAVARIGRNDPCPCGSGKKYKRCCIDKDEQRLQQSSDVPGVTLEELREQPEKHLNEQRLLNMRAYEVARLDPAKVEEKWHPLLLNTLIRFDEPEATVRFFEKLGIREGLEYHWLDAIKLASDRSDKQLVKRLLALTPEKKPRDFKLSLGTRLLMASDEEKDQLLDMIEAEALKGLKDDHSFTLVELAYDLLASRYPALGILAARGVISTTETMDAPYLLDALLETRDKLDLALDDPVEAILDQRLDDEDYDFESDSRALTEAQQNLEAKRGEIRRLRGELATLHEKLELRAQETTVENEVDEPENRQEIPVDDAVVTELRRRVISLKTDLKERHSERNRLRRELQEAQRDIENLRSEESGPSSRKNVAEAERAEDALLLEDEFLGSQPVRVPRFSAYFEEALGALPQAVSRAALRLIGRLSAGDVSAFQGVKRLKLNHEISRQQVGLHHRLLFHLGSDTLEVLALIKRKDLEREVRKLASTSFSKY